MSRWWLLLLAAGLLLGRDRLALTSPRPDRLRFAHTFTAASEQAILADAIRELEARHPGLVVEQVVQNSEVYSTLGWRTQFQGRVQPDVYFAWDGRKVEVAAARGWALDVRPLLSPGFAEQLAPAALPRDGPIHLLPCSVDLVNLVWFDRAAFRARGLSPPATFEAWIALCARLRREGLVPLAQGNEDLWPLGNLAGELLAEELGLDGLARLHAPGVPVGPSDLRGLEPLLALRDAGGFEPDFASSSDTDAKVRFLAGKSVQHVVGSWFLADLKDARRDGDEIDFFPVPPAHGNRDLLGAARTGFMVNPASANPRAAVELCELLLSAKVQARFAGLGYLSLRADAAGFTTDPLTRRMLELLGRADGLVPAPDGAFTPAQADLGYRMVARLLAGEPDVARRWSEEKAALARKGL